MTTKHEPTSSGRGAWLWLAVGTTVAIAVAFDDSPATKTPMSSSPKVISTRQPQTNQVRRPEAVPVESVAAAAVGQRDSIRQ